MGKSSDSFFSIVVAGSNFVSELPGALEEITSYLDSLVQHYELIVVDNGSTDETLQQVRRKLASGELTNTLVISLAQKTEIDGALWIGVDSAVGDYVITIPAAEDGVAALPLLLERAIAGAEVVIAANEFPFEGSLPFRLARRMLGRFIIGGTASLSRCMSLSRRLVSYLQSHSQPQMTFRQLSQIPGLRPIYLRYTDNPISLEKKTLSERYGSGVQYILWRNPRILRGASLAALAGAGINLAYAVYVFIILIFNENVEPGWASSSLQFSGMFFLFSLVLFVLSENLLLSISIAGRDPVAFIAGEYTSRQMGRSDALNVKSSKAKSVSSPESEVG